MSLAKTKMDLAELNKCYSADEAADKEVFAEMRSNVQLVSGEHYSKISSEAYSSHVRANPSLTDQQKLRLTKNHLHKIHKRFKNSILTYAGGISISPQKEAERQDQKAAELNQAVWQDVKYRYEMKEKIRKWADDFSTIGEVAVKVFWDPSAGDLVGYRQKVDKETDEGVVDDETGEMVQDETQPIFSGKLVYERLFGFNLMRPAGCKDMDEAESLTLRSMVPTAKLQAKYKDQPDKLKFIQKDANQEFVVFDASRGSYERSTDHTLVKEKHFKACEKYPEGYYVIWTNAGILEEGPHPYGLFPIKWKGFDEFATAPRGRSWVKQARPYQAEINRASSAMAMHQVTVGDDKIIYQSGTNLAPGALLPGVRGITYQGKEPNVLPGRSGAQYLDYILSQIDELYKVLDVDELEVEKQGGQLDPFALLFRSARDKQRFSQYSEKFEEFLVSVVKLTLELLKKYLPDDALVPAVGKAEYINLSEFRSTTPLHYRIHVEAQDETMETKFGRQLSIQHVLQYSGTKLEKEDIGKLVRLLPFANAEEGFSDFTLDYDNITNDILALERGEFPQPAQDDNHQYIINKLKHRTKQADFKTGLTPQIQRLFAMKIQMHEQMETERQKKLLAAKNEYIPVDGAMIACDMYVENETDPSKAPRRVRVPYSALNWLLEQMKAQGVELHKLEAMHQGAMEEMADMMINRAQGSLGQGDQGQMGQARPQLGASA